MFRVIFIACFLFLWPIEGYSAADAAQKNKKESTAKEASTADEKPEPERKKEVKPPVPPENQLTLEKSISVGLKGATTVLKAKNDVDVSGTQLLESYGNFLPNIQGIANYSYTSGTNYFTTAAPTLIFAQNYGPTFTLCSTLNIFNGLSDLASLKTALNKKSASELTYERAKQQIVIDITQAYLQVVLDKQIIEIADKNLTTSEERQRLLREQTRVGVRNLADLFRQEAQTSSDKSFLISSQQKLRTDEILLLRRLRLDVTQNYDYTDAALDSTIPKEVPPPEDEMVKTALEKRVDLKASQSTFEAADWGITQARSGFLPRIDLNVTAFSLGRAIVDATVSGVDVTPQNQPSMASQLGSQTYYIAGVTLTWNLFDRFQTAYNVSQARVTSDNARLDLGDRKLQVEGEIRQVYGDYRSAIQQLEAAKIGVQAADQAYENMKGRYEVGASSFLDLSTTQTALVQAQTTLVQSEVGLFLQRKLIDFYQGTTAFD
jgi:outer membrane protein